MLIDRIRGYGERLTTETVNVKYHPKWMQVMFILNIIFAGFAGVAGLLKLPNTPMSIPSTEPFLSGVAYSVWLGIAILSIAGLRSPLKFAPVLIFGMTYKTIWELGVVLPNLISGVALPQGVMLNGVAWIFIIVGYAVAVPWKYIFAK
jgi:hypothetical protein